jgi:putative membrane protein
MHMMWGDWGYGGWTMGFGMLFMLLFWAVLVIGTVALIRWMLRSPGTGAGTGPGRIGDERPGVAILKERYARGELSRDEFERMKRDLES